MTVQEFYTCQNVYDVANKDIDFNSVGTNKLMTEGVIFNCAARFDVDEKTGERKIAGNCTE